MKFKYDSSTYPPVPTMDIQFTTPAETLRSQVHTAMIDTGADATFVPVAYLDQIQAPVTVEMFIRSHWGERKRAMLYLVDIQIGDLTIAGVEVVGDERSDEIIVGRDVLNKFTILLNGPKKTVNIAE